MKKNRNIIIITVLLAAVALIFINRNYYSTLKDYETDFGTEDTASISKIFIADKNVNEVTLVRGEKSWLVNGDKIANTRVINTILSTLKRMKVKSPVSNAAYNNVVKRMSSISKKVELYAYVYRIDIFGLKLLKHEKLIKTFYVGDVTQDNLGTYMLMEDAERPYIVYLPGFRGFISTRFSPLEEDWLSHVVFHHSLSDIKKFRYTNTEKPYESFEVNIIDAMGNYQLKRISDGSILNSYDTLKVLNLLTSFSDLRYESRLNNLLPPQKIDSITHSPSLFKLTLIDKNQDSTTVKIFKKNRIPESITQQYEKLVPVDLDRMYGLINNGDDFVLMQFYVFDKVLYPLSYYTGDTN